MKFICLFYFVFIEMFCLIYISYLIVFDLQLETIWKILIILWNTQSQMFFQKKKKNTLTNKKMCVIIYVFNISSNFVYKYVIIVW